MQKIGFIDIGRDSALYIIERKGDRFEFKTQKHFHCSDNYEISVPELPDGVDEFYLSLPLSALDFRLLELPFSDAEKILNVLPFELDSIVLEGAESIISDGIILNHGSGKSRVLAVFVKKAVLSSILEKLRNFNINPKVVTSIELSRVIKDFSPDKLLNPVQTDQKERADIAIEEIKKSTINLRRGEFLYTGDTERIIKSLRQIMVLGIIALMIFITSFVIKTVVAKRELSFINRDIQKIYSDIFPEDKNKFSGLYQFKSKMKALKDKETYLAGISPLNLLLGISNINRGNIFFSEIAMDRDKVTLKGEASAFSDVQNIKNVLADILDDANIADSKTSVQGKVLFTITGREKKG